jgi:hypothetical protein
MTAHPSLDLITSTLAIDVRAALARSAALLNAAAQHLPPAALRPVPVTAGTSSHPPAGVQRL